MLTLRKQEAKADHSKPLFLVVSEEAATVEAVTSAMNGELETSTVENCADLKELVRALTRRPARCVLIDIDPAPKRMLDELEGIISRFTQPMFVLLSTEVRENWLIQAMAAGARHFVRKKDMGDQLRGVLDRLAADRHDHTAGSVVTVLAAGGGCGATTLAVNLGFELGAASETRSLIVDLDCAYGGAGGYLGVAASYGVADVLQDIDRVDAQLIRSSAVDRGQHLALLASPATVDFQNPPPLHLEAIGPALQECRAAFRHTVVDAPRVSLDIAEVIVRASQLALVVLEPNVEDIRVARAIVGGLKSRGIGRERIRCVLNRCSRRRMPVGLADARKALGDIDLVCLTNDFRGVVENINLGKTLAERSPRSALRREIRELADSMQATAAESIAAA